MTLPLDDEALAPCPFCGGAAEIDYRRAYAEILSPHRISHQVAIYCLSCSAEIALDPIEINADPAVVTLELTECWNRRALATQALEAQRLREALDVATDVLKKAIWDAVEVHIDGSPVDGINAEGEFSAAVQFCQRKYVDGLRAARLAALGAVRLNTARAGLHPTPSEGETK